MEVAAAAGEERTRVMQLLALWQERGPDARVRNLALCRRFYRPEVCSHVTCAVFKDPCVHFTQRIEAPLEVCAVVARFHDPWPFARLTGQKRGCGEGGIVVTCAVEPEGCLDQFSR